MKVKKTLLGCAALMLVLMPAYSATAYADILAAAKANSPQMKNAELTYQNNLLTQQKNDLNESVKVTVSSGEVSVLPAENSVNPLTGRESISEDFSMNPTVSVELPNDGNTTITASSGVGFEYGNSSYYNLTPSLSASHTFDLTGYDKDAVTDLSNASAKLSSELTYQSAILSFENQVLTSINSLVTAEKSLASYEKQLSDLEQTLSDSLALGKMTESSINYRQSRNQIALTENTIAALEKQMETAKQQYTTLTGLVWDGVADLPDPALDFTVLESGNTNVILKSVETEIASENINAKNAQLSPKAIAVSGGASSVISSSGKSLTGNVGATYSQGNWSVGSKFSGTYDDSTFTPALTFTGTWTNKTSKKSDELELQMLSNNYLSAQNEYQSQMTSYVQSAQNLELQVLQYSYKVDQQKATDEYLAAEAEYQQELFDAGLATEKDVKDAQFELSQNEYDKMLLTLEGLQLENSIKQLNL